MYYYPGFQSSNHGEKLRHELARDLTRETAWEAVMRIRCGKGDLFLLNWFSWNARLLLHSHVNTSLIIFVCSSRNPLYIVSRKFYVKKHRFIGTSICRL